MAGRPGVRSPSVQVHIYREMSLSVIRQGSLLVTLCTQGEVIPPAAGYMAEAKRGEEYDLNLGDIAGSFITPAPRRLKVQCRRLHISKLFLSLLPGARVPQRRGRRKGLVI